MAEPQEIEAIASAAARAVLTEVLRTSNQRDDFVPFVGQQGIYEARLREIVRDGATEALTDILERLGIDTKNPEEMRKDMLHLRSWREIMEFIRTQGIGTAVRLAVGAGIAALGAAIVLTIHRAQ